MDSNARENVDSKAEFRKLANDAANRKYRRRSPLSGSSSSSDGSPRHERSANLDPSKKDISKVADDKREKDDGRESDKDYDRIRSSRGGESYPHSSRSCHRNDDQTRHYSEAFHHSGRDSRDLKYSRGDKERRSRDYPNDVGKYPREKSDGLGNRSRDKDISDRAGSGRRNANIEDRDMNRVRDREDRGGRDGKANHRSFGDRKFDSSPSYEESRGRRDVKKPVRDRSTKEEKMRYDDRDEYKELKNKQQQDHSDAVKVSSNNNQNSAGKKPKLFSLDTTGPETNGTSEQAYVTDTDIDAAKAAAIKAAELVHKNLLGTGYMSTDQKKKLLWGNKKNTTTEESAAHRWETTAFGDRERQEKFKKLMGVKGNTAVELKSDNPDMEKQREKLQMDLEKQYIAGLRRKDGRTVGLGL